MSKELDPTDSEKAPLVRLCGVKKVYDSGGKPVCALDNVWGDFAAARLHVIVGKSGAGKSTLLNMIAGIDRATAGEILVNDMAIHTLSEDRLAIWRGRHVGVVYQSFELLPTLSLLDNVLLPIQFAGRYDHRHSPQWAMSLLERVGLADHAHKPPSAVSGGQRQRAAIARALANQPGLLVADEPTGSLDVQTANAIFELLLGLVESGLTVIMVTHDLSLAAAADETYTLTDGHLMNSDNMEAHGDYATRHATGQATD